MFGRKKIILIFTFLGILAVALAQRFISAGINKDSKPSPTIQPIPTFESEKIEDKQSYSIAIVGDSMIDTMGEDLSYLADALENKYTDKEFIFYNYGKGAQTMFQAYENWDNVFIYKTRDYPAIPELKPDIIILSSFAYNPVYPFDEVSHKEKYLQLINKASQTTRHIYILAEIAPLGNNFGKGTQEIADWTESQREQHSKNIITLLENAKEIGNTLNIFVIDILSLTKGDWDFGDGTYTNKRDGIHPSAEGHKLTADKIIEAIKL